jgi:hypothetical protein
LKSNGEIVMKKVTETTPKVTEMDDAALEAVSGGTTDLTALGSADLLKLQSESAGFTSQMSLASSSTSLASSSTGTVIKKY